MCLLPYCSLFFALLQSAGQPPVALHATVRSDFVYLASTRTTAAEYWISGDKLYEKRGEQIRIDRRDLGLTWMIDPQKSSYVERKIPPDSPAPPAAAQEDVHTLGFDYQPEFVWDVKDTAETQVLHGRICRLTVATGIAEFAETTLRLWFCPTAQEDQRRLNNVLVGLFRHSLPRNCRVCCFAVEAAAGHRAPAHGRDDRAADRAGHEAQGAGRHA